MVYDDPRRIDTPAERVAARPVPSDYDYPGERRMEDRIERERVAEPAPAAPAYERRVVTTAHEPRRFSLGATFLGWAVASFFTLLFTAIVIGIVGGATAGDGTFGLGDENVTNVAIGALVGLLIAVFLAYLIGGYNAGRISRWDGGKHGAAIVGWTILFAILAAIVTYAGMTTFNLGAYLAPVGLDFADPATLTTYGILVLVLVLAAMIGGGYLGGKLGERTYEREMAPARRRAVRGRPL